MQFDHVYIRKVPGVSTPSGQIPGFIWMTMIDGQEYGNAVLIRKDDEHAAMIEILLNMVATFDKLKRDADAES